MSKKRNNKKKKKRNKKQIHMEKHSNQTESKKSLHDRLNSLTKREILSYVLIILIAIVLSAHLSVVVSGSMEPAFYRGDIVTKINVNTYGIQEFNPYTDVKVGDVVVYDATWFSEPVVHRVIDKKNINGSMYYIIKGDHNPVQDPEPVSPSQIQSKVITIGDNLLVIPKIGYITILFRESLAYIMSLLR